MPESYRKFAVDFNQDGVSNIWQDRVDSIGSVANYLKSHGWERDEAIVVAAVVNGVDVSSLLSRRIKPRRHISEYTSFGIRVEKTVDDVLARRSRSLNQCEGCFRSRRGCRKNNVQNTEK